MYPSYLAAGSVVSEKKTFVVHLLTNSERSETERDAMIERVWSTPNLPFRVRSTLSAATLYFLIPLILAVVSAILGR
jgi:hypothetical protein